MHLLKCQFSRKTNKFLELFKSSYVVLLIKQHRCKVSTLRLHMQKTIDIFKFFRSNSTSPFQHPDRHIIFVFFYQNAIRETKQVKPLTPIGSTKSAHLLPDNSLEAFNGFFCTWKPVKFRWKHFIYSPYVHFVFTICSLYVHYIFIICSQCVHYIEAPKVTLTISH